MTAEGVLAELRAAGVEPYLDGGVLRGRHPPGAYSDELRALVAAHREAIVAHLAAEQTRADAALAEARKLLARLGRLAGDDRGRLIVVEVHSTLAERWHKLNDVKLYELPECLGDLVRRWGTTDGRTP